MRTISTATQTSSTIRAWISAMTRVVSTTAATIFLKRRLLSIVERRRRGNLVSDFRLAREVVVEVKLTAFENDLARFARAGPTLHDGLGALQFFVNRKEIFDLP